MTIWGAAANLLLAGLKMAVGALTGSVALLADGVHSLSDLLSDAVVMVGAWVADLPPDDSHPYGHGKVENVAALLVSVLLIGAGLGIAWDAGQSLYAHEEFRGGVVVLVAALISVAVKEWLYQWTRRVAIRTHSPSVLANAWHHRSDALSSVAVLAGGVAGFLGWGHGDQVAGLLVGLMVVGAGGKVGFDAIQDLMEHAIEKRDLAVIKHCLSSHPGIEGWHRLRTRKIGREIFVDVHVLMRHDLTVEESHAIVDSLENLICASLPIPANFGIHVEPHFDEVAF